MIGPSAAAFLAAHGAHLDLEGAAGVGRLDLVESFFNEDGSLKENATKRQLQAGFIWACEYGQASVAEFLLEKGVDLRAGENIGQTALHLAAHRGQLAMIKLLLDRGAPLEAINSYGGTFLGKRCGPSSTATHDRLCSCHRDAARRRSKIEPGSLTWLAERAVPREESAHRRSTSSPWRDIMKRSVAEPHPNLRKKGPALRRTLIVSSYSYF